jgi:GAF domain-containing protein
MPRLSAAGASPVPPRPRPAPGPPRPPGPPAPGAQSAAEASPAAEPAPPLPPRTAEEVSREFEQLQRWLAELREPQDATQISTLVMKVARASFERAALFVVKNESLRGLGGFGAAPREEKVGLLVREVVIPLGEPSVFARVALGRKPYAGGWLDEKWARHLLGKVGRFQSSGFALLPLLTNRETVAVLFGDNPDTGRPLGRLDTLETFVNQAGIALENAFLQRKVHAMQTQ